MVDTNSQIAAVDLALYGGEDPRDRPRYTYVEIARATGVPATTVGAWVRGQEYPRKHDVGRFEPIIRRPSENDSRLSFYNLIEVFVLRVLRTVYNVKLVDVRTAVGLAEREFGIERLLIHQDLRTSAGELFLESYFDLVQLSPAIQLAMRSILAQYLERVDFDQMKLATDFFPIERRLPRPNNRIVRVSPFVSFGQPVIARVGVTTHVITERVNAGEPQAILIEDYGLEAPEFEEAILYEAAA